MLTDVTVCPHVGLGGVVGVSDVELFDGGVGVLSGGGVVVVVTLVTVVVVIVVVGGAHCFEVSVVVG